MILISVRVGDRSEGKLQVLNCAKNLTDYTVTVCRNEKIFPKSSRWIMSNRLVNECLDALTCIRKANAVPLDEENIKYRRNLQYESKSHLEAMLALIDVAYGVFGIETRRIEHWTQLVEDTEIKLKSWIKSDKDRMKK